MAEKVALITGGGRGMGRAIAVELARHQVSSFVVSRTESELIETQKQVVKLGVRCEWQVCDVSREEDVANACRTMVEKLGGWDIAINNAGYFERADVTDQTLAGWNRVMGINTTGVFLVAREAFRYFKEKKKNGSIVNISSLSGIRGIEKFPGFASYVASKSAVVGLTEALAVEGRALGVRVNCIAPGAVDTQMLRMAAPQLKTKTTPEDIARVVWYFCDETQSGAVSGSTLEIFSNIS